MQVSSPSLARLEHLSGQLERTAYLLEDASSALTAVDFRTKSWVRDTQNAMQTTKDAWDAAQEFNSWSKSDAAEIDDFGTRKAAESAIEKADQQVTRNMTGVMNLSETFSFDMDRTTARHVVDTMARLSLVSGTALRDAASGMIELMSADAA